MLSPTQSSDYFELAQTTNTLLILSTMIFHDCIVVKGLIVPGRFNMKSPDGITVTLQICKESQNGSTILNVPRLSDSVRW